jgi:hypothetical protein
MIKVARGLRSSYTNFKEYTLPNVLTEIHLRTDCYEVLNEVNRPYIDIDGPLDNQTITKEEFELLDKKTRTTIETFFAKETYSLMTASSFLHKKISYRLVLPGFCVSKTDNKEWAKEIKKHIELEDPIVVDTGVYGSNQKMRMLGSNKDKENRPLRLLVGTPTDTLITYIPEGTEKLELPKEQKEVKPTKKPKAKNTSISSILSKLSDKRIDEYENWITIGMILFNEGEECSVWTEVSRRSSKYKVGCCEEHWKSFTKGPLTIATIQSWIDEDIKADYDAMKTEFELTHFKLNDPPVYVRLYKTEVKLLKPAELIHLYKNKFLGKDVFIDLWTKDPTIRTYEKFVFLPKLTPPSDCFNLFTDFDCEANNGDISVPQSILRLVVNNDEKVFEYIENWLAHLIQKPFEKPGTAIIVSGEQGVGKDTFFDFVGRMLGEYFYNTSRVEEDVFGRFNGHLKKILLLKFEEANFATNKKFADALKSLTTASTMTFEDKGAGTVSLQNYLRVIMTTNHHNPIYLEDKERRNVLIQASSEKKGDLDFWNSVHSELAKQETLEAYFYYLSTLDISNFNPRNRPITEYYEEVKVSQRPYHSQFFQRYIEEKGNRPDRFVEKPARELYTEMRDSGLKFELNETRFGLDMKKYDCITRVKTKKYNNYRFNIDELEEFLKTKGWWYDFE